MMPLLIRGVSQAEAASEAFARLDEVGLRARAPHRAGELSGGEQQRVVLARALVGRPSVLLADEPTGNLDTTTGDVILRLLRRIVSERKTALLMATHSSEAAALSDVVVHMRDGRVENVVKR
jgi:predicted ABC-type transport system involved in lysophospholipase L1 biosynthesis ATPase subunit